MPKSMLIPISQEETTVFTVSELNTRIKALLEANYRFVWVKGQISNFRIPASGHYYFTLKDEQSQIRGVLFRTQHRHLKFVPEDGLQVICQGRISVYEPRGEYQLIVEIMEPRGRGALQLAFEQLKKKLEAEGLFDPETQAGAPPLSAIDSDRHFSYRCGHSGHHQGLSAQPLSPDGHPAAGSSAGGGSEQRNRRGH